LVPAEEINLHFTGDLHAITAANNLLAAVIDNHLHWGDPPDIDPASITWKRCLDVNDRALRHIRTAVGPESGLPHETGFEITAASEVMAILSLADSYSDLSARLERIVIGSDRAGHPITAGDLKVVGSMAALLRDALKPNLVRTIDDAPALVHGGPFGNIAHGCSSVLATRMALKLGDICVTEAGFGADLGAEKFIDIKAGQSGLYPDGAVLVATVRALKLHGGAALADLGRPDLAALEAGFVNLERHAENLRGFGLAPVVAINRFASDTEPELERLLALCAGIGLPAAVADVWNHGGAGAEDVGRLVLAALEKPATVRPLYAPELPLREKIETLARKLYRAGEVEFLSDAEDELARLQGVGFGTLPVCMAKTQYSFSDNPELRGAPTGHTLTIRDAKLSAGAGFVVAYAGKIMTMPGLPRHPGAERIRLLADGSITGVS
jgi:formate--tetrahydrofolate ligase